jgi:type I restriction enzyme S subunit
MWEKVRLGDVIEILSGYAFDSKKFNDKEGVPIIRIRDIKRSFSETFYSGEYDQKYLINRGDVLIGMDGEFNISEWLGEPALLNQRVCKINSYKSELIERKYLLHFLPLELKYIEDKTAFVTVKHLSVNDIKEILIPLPPLPIQKRIAEILDTADALRRKDEALLKKYDELAQAIFIDMFGDPVKNEKGWEENIIKNIASKEKHSIKAGPFGSSLKKEFYITTGYKIYGQEQVIADDFTIGDYYIDEERYLQLKSCTIKEGDILISLVGTYGKISVVPQDFEEGIINPRLMKITLNRNLFEPYFFKYLLQTKEMYNRISLFSRGGTMDIVNVGIISDVKIIVPPIVLQKKFVERLKLLSIQRELIPNNVSTNLFNSLLQKAFNGELIV